MDSWEIKVFYDGKCPLCVREIKWLMNRNHAGRAAFEDISAPDWDGSRYGFDYAKAMARIHAVTPDGQVITGVEVFRRLYEACGVGWMMTLAKVPALAPLWDAWYEVFARNRLRWTGRGAECEGACEPAARASGASGGSSDGDRAFRVELSANDYILTYGWRVRGTIEEAFDILTDAPSLPRWWPAVYLAAEEIEPGDPVTHVGRVMKLHEKGWLPYTISWSFRLTESNRPHSFTVDAIGDLKGGSTGTFRQDGEFATIWFEARMRAEKPLLRHLSFALKPMFMKNYGWAMARGEESLALEMQRRRAVSVAERARVPAPPGPTFRWAVPQPKERASATTL